MDEPLGYLDGDFRPAAEMAISVSDAGFVLGTTVTEQLRTFAGRLFHLDEHLARLERSLEIVGVRPRETVADLAAAAKRLVDSNRKAQDTGDDLGLAIFVTPGPLPTLNDGRRGAPTVGLHTYNLPFSLWADRYQTGQSLVVTDIEQVAPSNWPAELKCRSRMHYHLADMAAERIEHGARALLLDAEGHVTETSTANVILYRDAEGFVVPPREDVLPGVSLAMVCALAKRLEIPWHQRSLHSEDVAGAEEVLLSSTPFCLLPVTRFNGNPIGSEQPGPMFQSIIAEWSREVGVDIVAQAQRFAQR